MVISYEEYKSSCRKSGVWPKSKEQIFNDAIKIGKGEPLKKSKPSIKQTKEE